MKCVQSKGIEFQMFLCGVAMAKGMILNKINIVPVILAIWMQFDSWNGLI